MRITFCLLSLIGTLAKAGVIFTMETQEAGGTKQMTVSIEGQRLRVEPQGQNFAFIWDGQAKTMLMVDAGQKQYTRLDAATMKRMGDTVHSAMAKMESQIAKLPPAQQEQMRAMMKNALQQKASSEAPKRQKWVWKALGAKKTVGRFNCTTHAGRRGDERLEVCVVPWDKSPVSREDLKGLTGLADFAKQIADSMGGGASPTGDLNAEMNEYPGFPIESVRTEKDETGHESSRTSRLIDAQRGSVAASQFATPAGFTEKSVPVGELPLE